MTIGQYYLRDDTGSWNSPGRLSLGNQFTEFASGTVIPIGALDVLDTTALPAGATRVANVGIQPTTLLTSVSGLVLESGQIENGLDISGAVTTVGTLTTPPKVTNSKIRGVPNTTTDSGLALGHSFDLGGTVFEWCDFDGTGNETSWLNGVSGGNAIIRYSTIARVVDAVHLTQGNITVEASRLYHGYYESKWNDSTSAIRTTSFTDHGGRLWTPPWADQTGSGDVHSDGIQIAGSQNNIIRGCYIGGANPAGLASAEAHLDPTVAADYADMLAWDAAACFKNSAIIMNALDSNPIQALIELNWLQGGAACANFGFAGQTTDKGAGVNFRNNIIVRAGSAPGAGLFVMTGWAGPITGTTYDNDGSPVTPFFHS